MNIVPKLRIAMLLRGSSDTARGAFGGALGAFGTVGVVNSFGSDLMRAYPQMATAAGLPGYMAGLIGTLRVLAFTSLIAAGVGFSRRWRPAWYVLLGSTWPISLTWSQSPPYREFLPKLLLAVLGPALVFLLARNAEGKAATLQTGPNAAAEPP
jgi:hypothetical protein